MTSVTANESNPELRKLLEAADLSSYYDNFIDIGGDNVQQLRDCTSDDFQQVINLVHMAAKPLHVKRLKKALKEWKPKPVSRTSTAADGAKGELHELLGRAGLPSYHDKFIQIGWDNVQRLCDCTADEFQEVVKLVCMAEKQLHVKRLKNALGQWTRQSAVTMPIGRNQSERELHELLQRADLLAYYNKFIEKGWVHVERLFDSTKEEFQEVVDTVGMAEYTFHVMRLENALAHWPWHTVTMKPTPAKKQEQAEICQLLEQAGLGCYKKKFMEIGADNVQQLHDLTGEEFHEVIDRVGMSRKPIHIKKLKKVLEEWTRHAGTSQVRLPILVDRSPETADVRAGMRSAIDRRDVEQVRKCMQEKPWLKMWLNPDTDESAMHRAVKMNAFNVYALLLSEKCVFKNTAESDCLRGLDPLQKSELERQENFVTQCQESHIYALKSRSKSQAACEGFDEVLDNLYRALDSSDLLRPVLKVASMAPYLSIRFDFEREHTHCMTGHGSQNHGLAYPEKQRIFVGAKGLHRETTQAMNDRTNEVAGIMVHELCHLALSLVYRNEAKPYRHTDAIRRKDYASILEDAKARKEDLHYILQWVFNEEAKKEDAELIVRVPHILALDPTEGDKILRKQVPKLYQFFKEHVIPDMVQCIRNGCPIKDIEEMREFNGKLGRASSTEGLKIEFNTTLDQSDLVRKPFVVLAASNLSFLEVMVNDLVRKEGVPYLFVEASQLKQETYDTLTVNKCSFLLLSCEGKADLQAILSKLKYLHDVTGTNVILLTSKANLVHCRQEVEKIALSESEVREDIGCASYENVTSKCKRAIVEKSKIALQAPDHHYDIHRILDTDWFLEICDEKAFLTLSRKNVLHFGPQLTALSEDVSKCYIEQKCRRSVKVDLKQIDERSRHDAFAILGCEEETLRSFLPKRHALKRMSTLNKFEEIVILDSDGDYNDLVDMKYYKGKTVHLLEFSDGCFMWRKSNGALSHLPMIGEENCSAISLLERSEKVVVVSGDSGTGKTVLATRLCTKIKDSDKQAWVLHVSNYPQVQEAMTIHSGQTGVINFIPFAKLCGVSTSGVEFELFQESVTEGRPFNVWVIFDALDEIQETTRKIILDLTKVLAKSKLSKILLFTRTVFTNSIQDEMHVVSFHMNPFSEDDQVQFLQNYTDQTAQSPSNTEAIGKTFEKIRHHVKMKDSSILGNPLLLRMMAEVGRGETSDPDYCDLVQSISNSHNCYLLLSVYRLFVEYKYLRYRKEKKNEDIGKAAAQDDDMRLKPKFYEDYGRLAVKAVLSQDVLKGLLSETESHDLEPSGTLMTDVKENRLKHGLIQELSNDVPRFVHHSFAEFFAADSLFKRLQKVDARSREDMTRIVSRLYGESSCEGMLSFLDGLAAERHVVHSSIMNNDLESFKEALENDCSLDSLERTPLHVAALHADHDILKYIPVNEALAQKDMIGMTPLMYADKIQSWDRLDAFCAHGGGFPLNWFEQLPTVLANLTSQRSLDSLFVYDLIYERRKGLLSVLLRVFCKIKIYSSDICIESAPRCFMENVSPDQDVIYNPVDIDRINFVGFFTPLYISIINDELDIFQMLLPYSSLNFNDMLCETALRECVAHGRTDMLKHLLPLTPVLQYRDVCLSKPDTVDVLLPHLLAEFTIKRGLLHNSIDMGHNGVTRAILPHTDASDRNTYEGKTALQVSVNSRYLDTVRLMLPYSDVCGIDMHVLAPLLKDVDDTDSLLRRTPHRIRQLEDVVDKKGGNDAFAIAQLVILHANIISLNIDAKTILLICMKCRNPLATFKLFLPHLSGTSRAIRQQVSAHYPLTDGEQDILKYLISYTPINTPGEDGYTPLVTCCRNGYLTAAKLLLPLTAFGELESLPLQRSVLGSKCDILEMLLPHSFKRQCNRLLLTASDVTDMDTMKLLLPVADVNDLAMMTKWRGIVERGDGASVQLFLPYTNTRESDISQNVRLLLSACKTSKEQKQYKEEEEESDDDDSDEQIREMRVPRIKILKLLILHSSFSIVDADRALPLDRSVANIHRMELLCPDPSLKKLIFPHWLLRTRSISVAEFMECVATTEKQDVLRYIISFTPINTWDENGDTPLAYCSCNGYLTAVKLLIPLTAFGELESLPLLGSVLGSERRVVEMLLPHSFKHQCNRVLSVPIYMIYMDTMKLLLPVADVNGLAMMTKWRGIVKRGDWASVQLFLPYTNTHESDINQNISLLLNACTTSKQQEKGDQEDEEEEKGGQEVEEEEESDDDDSEEQNGEMRVPRIKILKLLILHSSFNIVDGDRALSLDRSVTSIHIMELLCADPSLKKLILPHSPLRTRSISVAEFMECVATTEKQDVLRYIISFTPINTCDENGDTPLTYCSCNGYLTAVKLLIPLTAFDELESLPLLGSALGSKRRVVEMLLPHSFKHQCNRILPIAFDMTDMNTTKLLLPVADVNDLAMMTEWRGILKRGDWASMQLFLPYTNTHESDINQNIPLLLNACTTSKQQEKCDEEDEEEEKGGEEVEEEEESDDDDSEEQNGEMHVPRIKILKLLILHSSFNIGDADRALPFDRSVANIHIMELLCPDSSLKKLILPHSPLRTRSISISVAEFMQCVAITEKQDVLRYIISFTPINTSDENGDRPRAYCNLKGYLTAAMLLRPLTAFGELESVPLLGSVLRSKCRIVEGLLPHFFKHSIEIVLRVAVTLGRADAMKLVLPHVNLNARTVMKRTAWHDSARRVDWVSVQLLLPYTGRHESDMSINTALLLNACKESKASDESSKANHKQTGEMDAGDVKVLKLLLLHARFNIVDRALPLDGSIKNIHMKKLLQPHSKIKEPRLGDTVRCVNRMHELSLHHLLFSYSSQMFHHA
ncbi:uncharacterized protein LOC135375893 [Ornithodoros turicata]|uniref:uncharacterized protein LOC135375893 n=1 Tax=Ornithodoros turicata TaxID=34597 RepID=UPI003138E011